MPSERAPKKKHRKKRTLRLHFARDATTRRRDASPNEHERSAYRPVLSAWMLPGDAKAYL
jgi:hypothetical protein